jgi:hypothetical protein
MKTSVRLARVFTEIRTNHLANKSQNRYRLYKKMSPTDIRFITSAVAASMTVRLWTTNLTAEESGFDYSNSRSREFSFATTPRLTLGLTHPPPTGYLGLSPSCKAAKVSG